MSIEEAEIDNTTTNSTNCNFSKHDWLEEKFFLISICGTTIAILGLFGNVSTALVLTRPSMRTPNNLYLTTLALFDTFLLITAIMLYSIEYIFEYTDNIPLYETWLSYVPYVYALSHIAQTGSVYVTVGVTIERFIAVVYPDKSKIFCTQKGASTAIFWVLGFSVVFNCTKFFELEVVAVENCTGFHAYRLLPALLLQNETYSTVYSLWITQIVMVFAPFLILLIFNTTIALTIRKSFKRLRWVQRGKKRDELKEKSREATYVLIVIVLIFLICNLWGFVISLMERIYGVKYLATEMHGFYTFSREAVNFLTIVNSSINFIIYCIFGKDFRRTLVYIYGCKGGLTLFVPSDDKFTASRLFDDSSGGRMSLDWSHWNRDAFRLRNLFFRMKSRKCSNADMNSCTSTILHNANASAADIHDRRMGNGCTLPFVSSIDPTSPTSSGGSVAAMVAASNPLALFFPALVVSNSHKSTILDSPRNSTPSVTIFYSDDNVTWL